MHGLETIKQLNEDTAVAASAPKPVTANSVFTVIWQGSNDADVVNGQAVLETYSTGKGTDYAILADKTHVALPDGHVPMTDVQTFCTEVVPGQYGYLSVDDISEQEWGAIACGEQFDGDNKFDTIDVLYVIDGGIIVHLEGSDN